MSRKILILFIVLSGFQPTHLIAQSLRMDPIQREGWLNNGFEYSLNLPPPALAYQYQQPDQTTEPINWPAFVVTSSIVTGAYTGLFIYEQNHRWNVQKVPFHFSSGLNAKGFDKFGHFYATKSQAELISNLYKFSNISSSRSNLLGAGIALTVQSLIEIKDGKISDVGFDIYDQMSNLMGIAWFYGRENSAFLKRFNFRWFYHPSKDKQLLPKGSITRFIEDYNGHSYWLSAQISDIIPYWPRFVVPAAGITLNNWSEEQNQSGYYSYHLSLNPDFTKIIPQRGSFAKFAADLLNGFYIPAPAIEVYPDFGFELLFSIDI